MTESQMAIQAENHRKVMEHYSLLMKQATGANTATFLEALRALEVDKVVVNYDGGGDEGQMCDVVALTGSDTEFPLVGSAVFHSVRHDGSGYVPHEHAQMPLVDFAKDLASELVDEKHPGWEVGEGAYGEVTFDLIEKHILIEHNERFVESEHHTYEIQL